MMISRMSLRAIFSALIVCASLVLAASCGKSAPPLQPEGAGGAAESWQDLIIESERADPLADLLAE